VAHDLFRLRPPDGLADATKNLYCCVLRDPRKEGKRTCRESLISFAARNVAFPVSRVFGAVAELERSLIVERVKAGLRNAKAKETAVRSNMFLT
jgi:Resolvase, N terminal domain